MIPALRTSHLALIFAVLALPASRSLAAQGRPRPGRPPTQQQPPQAIDSATAADSTRNDSLRKDATDRLLEAEANIRKQLPLMPDLGNEGPRAAGSRVVFTRRDIAWRTAQSVADLLNAVPGVYIWRGGWYGRPVYANYRGRGANSIDWIVDGVPFVPLGPDSVGVDPGLFALALYERIEIEKWPSGLRVYLYTPQYGSLAPRSRVGITTGEFKITRYQGDLEHRWKSGLGLTTAFEYFNAPSPSTVLANALVTNALIRAQWVPRPDRGIQVQYTRLAPALHPYVSAGDSIGAFVKGVRSDVQVRVFLRQGDETRNFRADLLYIRSAWNSDTFVVGVDSARKPIGRSDSVHQSLHGAGVVLALRRPTWRVGATSWTHNQWTPFEVRGEGGMNLVPPLSVDAEVVHQSHDGSRSSDWTGIHGALALPLGFGVNGSARKGSRVYAPALANDTAQDIGESSVAGSFDSRYLSVQAGVSRTSSFAPYRFHPYLRIASLRPHGTTDWADLTVTLRPVNWLTAQWDYSDPKGTAPEGLPPTHSTVRGEIRSRFLRKYPDGIFELRLAGEMETWGTGVIGRDTLDAPMKLKGATFVRMSMALKLAGFQFFWDRVNTQSTRLTYVPGYRIPGLGQSFGVRWEFTN